MFTLTGTLHDHADQPLTGSRLIIAPTPSLTVAPDGDAWPTTLPGTAL